MPGPKSANSPLSPPSRTFMTCAGDARGCRSKSTENHGDAESEPHAGRFLDRNQLASRWQISISTLKRREATGELKPTRLGPRTIRYAMAHILEIEERGI